MPRGFFGLYYDVVAGESYPAEVVVEGQLIVAVNRRGDQEGESLPLILPGLVDAHVHIESTKLEPTEFARAAVTQGVLGVVADPHEIANVLGVSGIGYMMARARLVHDFCFGWAIPSCVPATGRHLETNGASLGATEVHKLLRGRGVVGLAEVMDYPAVLRRDPEVMAKIAAAKELGLVVDGHAPRVTGEDARSYFGVGISTDHECTTADEARARYESGVMVIVREGSAAKNADALLPVAMEYPELTMFCSDDIDPDEMLYEGYINKLVKRAVEAGMPFMDALRCATLNPVRHYRLPLGLLRVGDRADFIIVDSEHEMNVKTAVLAGKVVFEDGGIRIVSRSKEIVNRFDRTAPVTPSMFTIRVPFSDPVEPFGNQKRGSVLVQVIDVTDGQIVTGMHRTRRDTVDGLLQVVSSPYSIVAVINRYAPNAPLALGLVDGFGHSIGAIGSTIAHDSHNIIVLGRSMYAMAKAANRLIESKGGVIAINTEGQERMVSLPIAGLMSDRSFYEVAADMFELRHFIKSPLRDPLMMLSFLSLTVIPELKISDQGLVTLGPEGFKVVNIWD